MAERELGEAKYVRLYEDQLKKIDDYRANKRPIPEVSEAVRDLIDIALSQKNVQDIWKGL